MKQLYLIGILFLNLNVLSAQNYQFYALSNDGANSNPVYLCTLDSTSGAISVTERYSGVINGSYFAISSDQKHLLVTSKNSAGDQGGLVQYDISDDGALSLIQSQFKTGGVPCHVSFTPEMNYVLSAYYGDDKISLYNFTNDELTEEVDAIVKPDNSKGHCILTDPSGKYVHAVFLGLDKVLNFTIEENKLVTNTNQAFFSLPAGFGPRHLVFHPDSSWVYIVNELNSSVTACSYDPEKGVLTEIQNISMLPPDFTDFNSAAAIRIHPNGKFLYASNRGHGSIVVYEIANDGILSLVEHETSGINWPRDFNISADGRFMLVGNKNSNSIFSFLISPSTGELSYTGMELEVPSPLSIMFYPSIEEKHVGAFETERDLCNSVTAYPNPAQDILYINSPDETTIKKVEIFNLSGQFLKSYSSDLQASIDVTKFPRGAYLLFVSTEARKHTHKIILQ